MGQSWQGNAPGKQRPSEVGFYAISAAFGSPVLYEKTRNGRTISRRFSRTAKNGEKDVEPLMERPTRHEASEPVCSV